MRLLWTAVFVILLVAPVQAQMVSYSSDSLGFSVEIPAGFDTSKVTKRAGSELILWPDGRRLLVLRQSQDNPLAAQFDTFLKVNLSSLKGAKVSDTRSGADFADAVVLYQGAGGEMAGVFAGRPVAPGAMMFAMTGLPAKNTQVINSVREKFRAATFQTETVSQAHIDYCNLGLDTRDDAKAELLLKRCIELPRAQPEAFRRLGAIQMKFGRETEALSTFEAARKAYTRDPLILGDMARLLISAKDPNIRDPYRAASLSELASAATRQQDPQVELTLAEALLLSTRCEEAAAAAQRVAFLPGIGAAEESRAAQLRARALDPSQCKPGR